MHRRGRSARKEIVRHLRSADIFAPLGDDDLRRVAAAGAVERLGRGSELFRTGDPPDRVHLILEGSLEILRPTPAHPSPTPVAYLGAGELVGDMALLTGTPRRSLGRVPERATVWTLKREDFEALARTLPGYGLALAQVFARRLEEFITYLRRQGLEEGMAGHLEHFDLPTLVQTLLTSRQTGLLAIANAEGANVGQILLLDGQIARARCGVLEGEAGFCELFLREEPGEFHFKRLRAPEPSAISDVPIEQPAMSLLMEAMRIVDEVRRLKARLPPPSQPLARAAAPVAWTEAATAPLAEALLEALEKPRPLPEVVRELPFARHLLYDVAVRLYEGGHVSAARPV